MKKILPCILLLMLMSSAITMGQRRNASPVDSAKQLALGAIRNDSAYIRLCLFISDAFMDLNQYDSAQIWLDRLYSVIPERQNSLSNYFKVARQAMIYYYNNLPQLGLRESVRASDIAQSLKDSILLADNHNFFGLFYMLLDSNDKAAAHFQDGLKFARQPPYPVQYISLTKPHNLYGNLAEAYYKRGRYTDALDNSLLSFQKAEAINSNRGMAVAQNSLGDAYLALGMIDSAMTLYNRVLARTAAASDRDIKLITLAGLAQCYDARNNYASAEAMLQKGLLIFQPLHSINSYYSQRFLNMAIEVFRKHHSYKDQSAFQDLRDSIETKTAQQSSAQIQSVMYSSLANETRVLNMKIQEAAHKESLSRTRFALAVLFIIFLLLALFVSRYYQNQKLRNSELRNRISRDLHDDIGASLSSIHIFGDLATSVWDSKPAESREMVHKISIESRSLMSRMNDIVWSLKMPEEGLDSLTVKLRNYTAGILAAKGIACNFEIDDALFSKMKNPIVRKNILLIAKEAINNIAKYSEATLCTITLKRVNAGLLLHIRDDGKGFDSAFITKGNGLRNMKSRCAEIGGTLSLKSATGAGTEISCSLPIATIS